jgi:hypothetical protein
VQLHRHFHVFFVIIENDLFAVLAPAAFGDGLGNCRLVDVFPAFDAVGATGIGEAFAFPLPNFVGVVGPQNITGGEVGGVQVEDMYGELPAERLEARHLCPRAVSNEQRVGADVERWSRAEVATPQADGAYVLKVFVQHVHDHAQHTGKSAVFDFVFEVADVDRGEVLAHDSDCFAPIFRNNAGWSSVSIMRPAKARAMSSASDCVGHLGSLKLWGSRAYVIL